MENDYGKEQFCRYNHYASTLDQLVLLHLTIFDENVKCRDVALCCRRPESDPDDNTYSGLRDIQSQH